MKIVEARLVDYRPTPEHDAKIEELLNHCRRFALQWQAKPYQLFGDEIKIAAILESGKICLVSPNNFDTCSDWTPNLRHMFLRPAVEPVTYEFWRQSNPPAHSHQQIIGLASSLYGGEATFRTKAAGTIPNLQNVRTVFGDHEDKLLAIDRFSASVSHLTTHDFNSALVRFVNFMVCHPLSDGNGRTARVILQTELSHLIGNSFFSLPIGLVLYAWLPIYTGVLRGLYTGEYQNWSNFVHFMVLVLDTSLRLVEALHTNRIEKNCAWWGQPQWAC